MYIVKTDILKPFEKGDIIYEAEDEKYGSNRTKNDELISIEVIERNPEWFQYTPCPGHYFLNNFIDNRMILRVMDDSDLIHRDWHKKKNRIFIRNISNRGIYHTDTWVNENLLLRGGKLLNNMEVEEELIEEAEKRGYSDGVRIKNNLTCRITDPMRIDGNNFSYDSNSDELKIGHSTIYKCGQWAEIVDDSDTADGVECECNDKRETEQEQKSGVEMIREERNQQIKERIFPAAEDYAYADGMLAMTASYFAMLPEYRSKELDLLGWPWDDESCKLIYNNRIRELQKAGALIAAEIDRLQRKEQ